MNVITVSREYGTGGGEVARRLAEALGWELLDRQLLHQAAAVEHIPDADLEHLDEKAISMADRFRLHPPHQRYIHGLNEAAKQAAARGNVVLVGRGTRQLLGERADCFHLRLVAPRDCRVKRMAQLENWTPEQALARCLEVDRTRERFTRYFFGAAALQSNQYDLVVNMGRVTLDEVVAWVTALVHNDCSAECASGSAGQRVLTLARELGAGDTGFAPTLAAQLKLRVHDRELLEQEAIRLGVPEVELEKIDEQPAGILQRFRSGSLYQRYFESLGQIMNDLAARGDVLLVGRAGSRFLREHPQAFHVRLVAPMAVRLRRVMEHRWLRQGPAQKLISETDDQRSRFYQDYFGADWSDPLEYHITVNSGRLGPLAVDLIALAAQRFWDSWRGAIA
jgi:cytidylate kinase